MEERKVDNAGRKINDQKRTVGLQSDKKPDINVKSGRKSSPDKLPKTGKKSGKKAEQIIPDKKIPGSVEAPERIVTPVLKGRAGDTVRVGRDVAKSFAGSITDAAKVTSDGHVDTAPAKALVKGAAVLSKNTVVDSVKITRRTKRFIQGKPMKPVRGKRVRRITRGVRRIRTAGGNAVNTVGNAIGSSGSMQEDTAQMMKSSAVLVKDIGMHEIRKTVNGVRKIASGRSVRESGRTVNAAERIHSAEKQAAGTAVKQTEAAARNAAAKSVKTSGKTVKEVAEKGVDITNKTAKVISKIFSSLRLTIAVLASIGFLILIVTVAGAAGAVAAAGDIFTIDKDSMSDAITECMEDYVEKADKLRDMEHNIFKVGHSEINWKEIIAVYAVKLSIDPDEDEALTELSGRKRKILMRTLEDMNPITYDIVTEKDESGKKKKRLEISFGHKSADNIIEEYGFDEDQTDMLHDLLSESDDQWEVLLSCDAAKIVDVHDLIEEEEEVKDSEDISDYPPIVQVAYSQLGQVGGEPYWSWYGFQYHVEWCACFVSWCANQCGYIENGLMDKFSLCFYGQNWFKGQQRWLDGSVVPEPGMIIFFDWNAPNGRSGPQDGRSDHVGIVYKVENGIVYTIEGNAYDVCRINQYAIGHYEILGYGIMK